jgi:uncharacterized protein (TIGR00288 family)
MTIRHSRPALPKRSAVAPVHRGPQAAAAPLPSPVNVPFHAPNAALLIDFDNVTMGIRSDLASELKNLLSSDIVRGKVSVQRAYADWRRYPQYIVPLTESSIDLIFAPAYGSSKKNATDIRLAIDALELVFTRPEIGTFILLSGDSDFSSLVLKLKEYGKYVIGVGIRESSSELLVQNCDEYYSYNALAGLVNTRDEEVMKWDPWDLAAEAVQRMKRNGDVMRADRLKQVMQQIDSSFDEKNLGMSKFSRFVTDAAQRGILLLHKMENGQLEVDVAKTQTNGAAPTADVTDSPASDTALPAEEPRRGRSRRGRGRSRDRDERRPSRDAARETTDDSTTTEISATESPAQLSLHPVAPQEPAASSPLETDTVGLGGMRLTRDGAFDLVRRAVEAVTASGMAARASDIRATARELLGRDSESLSERNFIRILKDAHDANLIDLRRRGDDYEVAQAAAALSIAEQIGATERAQAAATPAVPTPPAPRGMAPRGSPSRGRGRGFGGKATSLPSNLLSIGVVEDHPAPSVHSAASHSSAAGQASVAAVDEAPEKRPSRPRKSAVKKGVTKTAAKGTRKKTV